MQWEILDRDGWSDENRTRVDLAVKSRTLGYFAEETGRSEQEVAELLEAGKRNSGTEVTSRTLPSLKRDLSPNDWQALRRYLFDRAAQSGAFDDF